MFRGILRGSKRLAIPQAGIIPITETGELSGSR